jgi:hypothetical protein
MDVSNAQTREARPWSLCLLTTCRGCQYSRPEPDGLSHWMGVGKYCGDESVIDEKTEFNQPLFGYDNNGRSLSTLRLICLFQPPALPMSSKHDREEAEPGIHDASGSGKTHASQIRRLGPMPQAETMAHKSRNRCPVVAAQLLKCPSFAASSQAALLDAYPARVCSARPTSKYIPLVSHSSTYRHWY